MLVVKEKGQKNVKKRICSLNSKKKSIYGDWWEPRICSRSESTDVRNLSHRKQKISNPYVVM